MFNVHSRKKTRSGQFVKTHLVYGDDPRVQRFIVPHKDHPETKLEFEVHFTEKQIKAQTKICTKARVLMHSDCAYTVYSTQDFMFMVFL